MRGNRGKIWIFSELDCGFLDLCFHLIRFWNLSCICISYMLSFIILIDLASGWIELSWMEWAGFGWKKSVRFS